MRRFARPVLALGVLIHGFLALAQGPMPPVQPATGPGGRNYLFGAVTTNGPYWANGRTTHDQFKYYIFEPASPTPQTAPLILFIHGFIATVPSSYQGWINQLVLKGYVVVWVQYQTATTLPTKYTANALAAWQDALYRLQNFWWENHVKPVISTNGQAETMIVGHSAGGWIGANIAAGVTTTLPSIPTPWALVAIEPASKSLIPQGNFAHINANTKMVTVVGDCDNIGGEKDAQKLNLLTPQIPAVSKNLLWVQSDITGTPNQVGNHYFPNTDGFQDTSAGPPWNGMDDRDFNITWKLSVAMAECVFGSTVDANACDYALGRGSANQVSMGNWSNGAPVKPLLFFANPASLPATLSSCPHNP